MYSLRILFFSLPLYFSHVLGPFGVVVGESYSFERQKVYLFLILLVIAYIEILIRYPDRILEIFRKYTLQIGVAIAIPVVSALYFVTSIDPDWLRGGHEKHHGYLFYMGIVLFVPLLLVSTREHLRSYLNWSMSTTVVVALISIGEYTGGILDIYGRGEMTTSYLGRAVSTLGNPNYLAGYLLMILPLLTRWRSPERWIAMLVIVFAILTTGSYIAISLLGVYCFYILLRALSVSKFVSGTIILISTMTCLIIGANIIDPDKILSLTSRFVLMRESLSVMFADPVSFLIGFGPDSLLSHFSTFRSQIVNSYFPSDMLIDSSHNIVIDIFFQYGALPLILIGFFLYRYFSNQKEELQIAILLGIIFLIFNVFVVVHIILIILIYLLLLKDAT